MSSCSGGKCLAFTARYARTHATAASLLVLLSMHLHVLQPYAHIPCVACAPMLVLTRLKQRVPLGRAPHTPGLLSRLQQFNIGFAPYAAGTLPDSALWSRYSCCSVFDKSGIAPEKLLKLASNSSRALKLAQPAANQSNISMWSLCGTAGVSVVCW
jgi:hypothetical protein